MICNYCGVEFIPKVRGKNGLKQKFCSYKCRGKGIPFPMKGKRFSQEFIEKCKQRRHSEITLKKMSESHKGQIGVLCGNWKGGITPLHSQIRMSLKYIEWRSQIFDRDDFTCQC